MKIISLEKNLFAGYFLMKKKNSGNLLQIPMSKKKIKCSPFKNNPISTSISNLIIPKNNSSYPQPPTKLDKMILSRSTIINSFAKFLNEISF
jgi:hypothetical protein